LNFFNKTQAVPVQVSYHKLALNLDLIADAVPERLDFSYVKTNNAALGRFYSTTSYKGAVV